MWRTSDGDRVFTEAEWEVFAAGLDLLRDSVEQDISGQADDTDTGVPAFDRLTPEQKLALLAGVASALRDPSVPPPPHTAANEGAVMAVYSTFRDMVEAEVEDEGGETTLRQTLLAAVAGSEDLFDHLPGPASREWGEWDGLCEWVSDRVLWDHDFDLGDVFLDLPPAQARAALSEAGIDPGYYLDTPPEPGEQGLTAARQTLARLLGLAIPGDDGLYPALLDRYHDLCVGPTSLDETDAWRDNPWVEEIRQTEPAWDCDWQTWVAGFSGAVPAEPFRVRPATPGAGHELPAGMRVERLGDGWVVREEYGAYWSGLVENGWTESQDECTPALTFPTEADARAAFAQADQLYGERAARHERAMDRLGATDE